VDANIKELEEGLKGNQAKAEARQEKMEAMLVGSRAGRKHRMTCLAVTEVFLEKFRESREFTS
jgi:hypothetical protein